MKSEAMEKRENITSDGTNCNKRLKADESANTSEALSHLEKIRGICTDQLVTVGKNNTEVLSEIKEFSERLQKSIKAVEKEIDEERKEREKKERNEKEAQEKIDREVETKRRQNLIDHKQCFKCNAVSESLTPCATFTHDGGVSGDGVLLCDECMNEVCEHICPSCESFMHKPISESCDGGTCQDDYYRCKACEELYCLPCAEEKDLGKYCDCQVWYCNTCFDEKTESVSCSNCSAEELTCDDCRSEGMIVKCEGTCGKPICEKCTYTPACGSGMKLCSACDYDCCERCEYCPSEDERWCS